MWFFYSIRKFPGIAPHFPAILKKFTKLHLNLRKYLFNRYLYIRTLEQIIKLSIF